MGVNDVMQYHIYWTPQTELLELQGANIRFDRMNQVFYENQWLPSGQVVARWASKRDYIASNKLADLPYLIQGETYELERDITNANHMFGYLTITFFDVYHRQIVAYHENKDIMTFEVPKNYDAYEIELITAGAEHIIFHEFTIRLALTNGTLLAGDHHERFDSGEDLYWYLQEASLVTSQTLRVIFSEPSDNMTDYAHQWIVPTQQNVLYIADGRLLAGFYVNETTSSTYETALKQIIQDAKVKSHAAIIEFIGYGPISSYAAGYYQKQMTGKAVISSDAIVQPTTYLAGNQHNRTTQSVLNDGKTYPIISLDDAFIRLDESEQKPLLTQMPGLRNPNTARLKKLYYETPELAEVPFIEDDNMVTTNKHGWLSRLFHIKK